MKNLMKAAHKLTKEIKVKYPEVDYKAQLGICISYLYNLEKEGKEMKEFRIYNSLGKEKKITIGNVKIAFDDCVRLDAEYGNTAIKGKLVCFGGKHKKPFLRVADDDIELTKEIIEYLWKEIGCPYKGLLYRYTKNYEANYCE